ncbi:MAG: hypothetical protein K1X85_05755, partial [Ignavibacteria bacterium]|nr:hypothetical protein [Ignavibacteria bacterium]
MKHIPHTRAVTFLSSLLYFFSIFVFINAFNTGSVYSQWYQQSIPVSKLIKGLEFIDSLKGWAVTDWGNEQDTSYI